MATTNFNHRFRAGDRVRLRALQSDAGVVDEIGNDDKGPIALVLWDKQPAGGDGTPSWACFVDLELEPTPRDEFEAKLQDVSLDLAKTADEQGFARVTWDTTPAHLMFVMTELWEAWDATNKASLAEELADIAIRILVQLRNGWGDIWEVPESGLALNEREGMALTVELLRIGRHLSNAANAWRSGYTKSTKDAVRVELEQALGEVIAVASTRGFDLIEEIAKKNVANAARPYLHGRAEAIG